MAKENKDTVADQENTGKNTPGNEGTTGQANANPEAPAEKEKKEKKVEQKGPTFRVRSANPIKGESTAAFYFYTTDLKRQEAVVKMIDGIVQNMPQGCSVDDLIAAGFIRF